VGLVSTTEEARMLLVVVAAVVEVIEEIEWENEWTVSNIPVVVVGDIAENAEETV